MILLTLKDLWRVPSRESVRLFGATPSSGATAVGVSSWPGWNSLPDSISLLENHRADHEERITAVEQRLGLRP
jgi:hypothetical protein